MTSSILFKFGKLALIVLSACITVACAASADAKERSVVDHALIELHKEFLDIQNSDETPNNFKPTNPAIRVSNGFVWVDAMAMTDAADLKKALRSLGATQLSSYGLVVSCLFPITAIDDLAAVDSLRFMRPAYAQTRAISN